jgi:hypothetical protein
MNGCLLARNQGNAKAAAAAAFSFNLVQTAAPDGN